MPYYNCMTEEDRQQCTLHLSTRQNSAIFNPCECCTCNYTTRKIQYTLITSSDWIHCYDWMTDDDKQQCTLHLSTRQNSAIFTPCECCTCNYTTRKIQYTLITSSDWIHCYDLMTEDERGECTLSLSTMQNSAIFTPGESFLCILNHYYTNRKT